MMTLRRTATNPAQPPRRLAIVLSFGILPSVSASSVRRGSEDFHMTSRFPGPWRIVKFPNGFAVHDATCRQLGFFYGADPNMAGHAGVLLMDDARQLAVDFARRPELLNQTSGRSEVATSPQDNKLPKPGPNRTPQLA